MLAGNADRLKREHNDRAWAAWHAGMIGRAAKPPRLQALLIRDQPKAQSIKEMIAHAGAWTTSLKPKD